MNVVLTSPRSELASVITRVLEERASASRTTADEATVVINVALQAPNSLLHDGQAWKRYPPERILAETRSALRRASHGSFLVHAGYLFAGAEEAGLQPGNSLQPIIDASLRAEELVLASGVPSCVVRLGYLYGPESRSLKSYRRAFRLGRPYWAGPSDVKQRFLHTDDAAAALLAAARTRPAGRLLAAADNQAVSFATFVDHFARLIGNPLPLHLPGIMAPISRVIIAKEHMQAVELPTGSIRPNRRPGGFRPDFPTYRAGLRHVVTTWQSPHT